MNNPDHPEAAAGEEKELMSAMFAGMVMQQTNMTAIFLGLAPHPQTGQMAPDLARAKYFIDQLEMLEAKTRGNLDKHEQALLQQSLTSLRLAFVEAAAKPAATAASAQPAGPAPGAETAGAVPASDQRRSQTAATGGAETPGAVPPSDRGAGPAPQAVAEDSRKKFTKKY
jgi:hypothetical protein